MNLVLIDTCCWIDYFKKAGNFILSIDALLDKDRVCTSGQIIGELIQGIRSKQDRTKIVTLFEGLHYLEHTRNHWIQAASLIVTLRKQGIVITLSDAIIGITAKQNGCSLLTVDKDFNAIAKEINITLFDEAK